MLWDALEEAPLAFGGRGGYGTGFEGAGQMTVGGRNPNYRGARERLEEYSRARIRDRGIFYVPSEPPNLRRRGRP